MPSVIRDKPPGEVEFTVRFSPADFNALADIVVLAQEAIDAREATPPEPVSQMLEFLNGLEATVK